MEETKEAPDQAVGARSLAPWDLYRQPRPIRSAGRTVLPMAFANYLALCAGISPNDIAKAFDAAGDEDDRDFIEREIQFLTNIFLDGRIRTYARQFGGGEPVELSASAWEIDDPVIRFATGSLNIERPHDQNAQATHWVFVDDMEWDAAMDGLRASRLEPPQEWHAATPVSAGNFAPDIAVTDASGREASADGGSINQSHRSLWRQEILTLQGVIDATGLKKSTIYAKIRAGSFPTSITLHGTRKGWRRGDVQDWLDGLTQPE